LVLIWIGAPWVGRLIKSCFAFPANYPFEMGFWLLILPACIGWLGARQRNLLLSAIGALVLPLVFFTYDAGRRVCRGYTALASVIPDQQTLVFLAILAAIASAVAMFTYALLVNTTTRKLSRFRWPHCTRCGYDRTGNVSGRCPECPEPIKPSRGGSAAA
jgi:hypothetical protein